MKAKRLVIAALAGAAAVAAPLAIAPAQAPKAAKAQRDWTQVIARTPEGGFRMGNPEAPIKLVEYLSLTCGHCATFAAEGMPALLNEHVRPGRVSVEYRNFVLNPFDLSASLLSRCAADRRYFALSGEIMARQSEWMGRVRDLDRAQVEAIDSLPPMARLARIAEITGLTDIAARHGINADAARACLADENGVARLVQMREAGTALGVHGTPSFLVNGRLVEAHHWAALRPLLRPPGGR
ncbi:MAG: DsbA family protein [Allosphingosinicella sp.]|uniref:DsbA family protein n=1 Tax=Allosphingosinicella sp. TaxID=2823234 RepID=UPI0039288A2F